MENKMKPNKDHFENYFFEAMAAILVVLFLILMGSLIFND